VSTARAPAIGLDAETTLAQHVTAEAGRWDERAPPGAVAPETAWADAHSVGRLRFHDHFDAGRGPPDEVRVYHGDGWSMVFVRMEFRVVTCYRVSAIWDNWLRGELFAAGPGGDR
jgi:hypothetical protein